MSSTQLFSNLSGCLVLSHTSSQPAWLQKTLISDHGWPQIRGVYNMYPKVHRKFDVFSSISKFSFLTVIASTKKLFPLSSREEKPVLFVIKQPSFFFFFILEIREIHTLPLSANSKDYNQANGRYCSITISWTFHSRILIFLLGSNRPNRPRSDSTVSLPPYRVTPLHHPNPKLLP